MFASLPCTDYRPREELFSEILSRAAYDCIFPLSVIFGLIL